MAAVRAVAPYLGASTYTWTFVIGVMLAALSAGYYLGGGLIDRSPRPVLLYAVLLAAGVLCLVVPVAVRPVSRWLVPADLGVEDAVGHLRLASFIATLLLFAPPALLMGGVSPMVVKFLASADRVGGAAGRVFALSTLGSIAGTFATTFLMIPELGTRTTIGAAGGVLCLLAAGGLLFVRVPRTPAAAGGAAALAVLAVAGVLVPDAAAGPVKRGPGQVAEVESCYQYVRVLEGGEPREVILQINEAEEAYQSVATLGPEVLTGGRYYDYYSVLPLMLGAPERRRLRCAVIGLAAGTIPLQLRHFYPEGLEVVGVEIDPAVIELAREHFDLPVDEPWLEVVTADGRVWLNGAPDRGSYDLVVLDAFAQEYYIPFHLATKECFEEIRALLRPGGVVAMNACCYRPDDPLIKALGATLREAFGDAWRVQVQGYPNAVLFAVKGGEPSFGSLRAPPQNPAPEWEEVQRLARYVGSSAARITAEDPGRILTDDHAPVERLIDHTFVRESRAAMGD
jgi:spermidine synthase